MKREKKPVMTCGAVCNRPCRKGGAVDGESAGDVPHVVGGARGGGRDHVGRRRGVLGHLFGRQVGVAGGHGGGGAGEGSRRGERGGGGGV